MFYPGPAHAVYFGTYEAVKQKLGGNVGSEHHPFAVGMASIIISVPLYVNFHQQPRLELALQLPAMP